MDEFIKVIKEDGFTPGPGAMEVVAAFKQATSRHERRVHWARLLQALRDDGFTPGPTAVALFSDLL